MAAIGPITTYLPRLVADMNDLEAIGEMQVAATLSSLGVYSAWTGIHHGIVHVIGGRFTVPHANIHALMLPYAMRWNLDGTTEAMARMARVMGVQEPDDVKAAAEAPEVVYRHEREDGASATAPGPGDPARRAAVPWPRRRWTTSAPTTTPRRFTRRPRCWSAWRWLGSPR